MSSRPVEVQVGADEADAPLSSTTEEIPPTRGGAAPCAQQAAAQEHAGATDFAAELQLRDLASSGGLEAQGTPWMAPASTGSGGGSSSSQLSLLAAAQPARPALPAHPAAWASEAQLSAEVAAARRALEEARRQGGAQEGGGCAARAEARRLLEGVIRWSAKQKSQ